MSDKHDTESVNHLLTLCHSYTEEGFIVEGNNITFKVVGDSLFMHSINESALANYKEFSCEVFNVHNPITNERLGYMIHYINKNVFRCFFEKNYIGFVVKYFIMFQKDMMIGRERGKERAIYEEALSLTHSETSLISEPPFLKKN
jgi:hypothetical protein